MRHSTLSASQASPTPDPSSLMAQHTTSASRPTSASREPPQARRGLSQLGGFGVWGKLSGLVGLSPSMHIGLLGLVLARLELRMSGRSFHAKQSTLLGSARLLYSDRAISLIISTIEPRRVPWIWFSSSWMDNVIGWTWYRSITCEPLWLHPYINPFGVTESHISVIDLCNGDSANSEGDPHITQPFGCWGSDGNHLNAAAGISTNPASEEEELKCMPLSHI